MTLVSGSSVICLQFCYLPWVNAGNLSFLKFIANVLIKYIIYVLSLMVCCFPSPVTSSHWSTICCGVQVTALLIWLTVLCSINIQISTESWWMVKPHMNDQVCLVTYANFICLRPCSNLVCLVTNSNLLKWPSRPGHLLQPPWMTT